MYFPIISLKNIPRVSIPRVPEELVYSGAKTLTESVEGLGIDAGKLVLSPTRTYAPVIREILDNYRSEIHGLIHCSGGAQTKVLHFVEHVHVIKDNMFNTPPLFKLIQEQSGTEWKEMYKVFNMGAPHGSLSEAGTGR